MYNYSCSTDVFVGVYFNFLIVFIFLLNRSGYFKICFYFSALMVPFQTFKLPTPSVRQAFEQSPDTRLDGPSFSKII